MGLMFWVYPSDSSGLSPRINQTSPCNMTREELESLVIKFVTGRNTAVIVMLNVVKHPPESRLHEFLPILTFMSASHCPI